jgi:hypothetical protein
MPPISITRISTIRPQKSIASIREEIYEVSNTTAIELIQLCVSTFCTTNGRVFLVLNIEKSG